MCIVIQKNELYNNIVWYCVPEFKNGDDEMKRKVLCSILAILIIFASVPMTAFAADAVTITKVDLTATKNLIEGYNCHIE